MPPLRYAINITVDGCCDHRAGVPDEELHRHTASAIADADALLFGRVTYQMMEEAWRAPAESGEVPDWMDPWMLPFARSIHAARKYVVSRTLDHVDWNAELVRGDLGDAVRRLRAQAGKRILVGGTRLALALTELGLIDEYEILVHPRIAGHGPTIFAGLTRHVDLKLVDRTEFKSGVVVLRYETKR